MEVKEAVEVLTYYDAHYYDTAHTDELAEIIDMLYEGKALKAENVELKAYKQMWEKFYKEWGEYPIELHNIAEFMGDLEQKYLKKAKKIKCFDGGLYTADEIEKEIQRLKCSIDRRCEEISKQFRDEDPVRMRNYLDRIISEYTERIELWKKYLKEANPDEADNR